MSEDQFSDIIQQNLKNNLPFCVYKKPKKAQVSIITQNNDKVYKLDDFKESGFVFAPFNDISETIFFPLNISKLQNYNFPNKVIKKEEDFYKETKLNQKKKHINLVENTITFLKNNNADKIVISRKECFKKKDFNLTQTFINLLNSYNEALVYLWFHPKIGLWIGATPEILLTVKNNYFTTMSLAGTQKKNQSITWKDKEIKEQLYVTDYITEILEKNKIRFTKSEPQTIVTGNVAHIQTIINGTLKPSFNLKSLIKDLHPTPAVCGIPKELAKKFILTNEGYNREFYTGFLGELNYTSLRNRSKKNIENQAYNKNTKKTNLFVNLRCLKVNKNEICFYIGGGITKDSNATKEYTETVEKSKNLKNYIV
jgi:isochorismate synthase